ncbi:CG9541 [Drosophila busckii]|uniref:CG9541 n=1 Tax=Drosophila busckii TaxID=30019 RepID=A0A0M3QTK0_DROBS|nr:CG9541 [Drosophila busckii]
MLNSDASAAQDTGEQGNDWNRTRNQNSQNPESGSAMALNGNGQRFGSANIGAIQHAGKIKFDPPKVPVIFVLGGPGSGKVTHCDTFMQERRGVTHINMMDLLQQYAMGNDMQDFSQLSSKTVTEVLMLEMKMAPAAKAYLISGYPRSMRDVVEYSEKIQVVNGVILISWRQSVLQKQIDYGAKLGHVVLSLAKMELENFFKNVMPVADYFDQSDMLLAVNGERAPTEVYKDFRTAVLDILSQLENQEAMLNGVTGMGRGIHDIPGSIVSVDTAPSQVQAPQIPDRAAISGARVERNVTNAVISHIAANAATATETLRTACTSVDDDDSGVVVTQQPRFNQQAPAGGETEPESHIPHIIWVIGGPGSNKATLCIKAVGLNPGWAHISVGRLLRNITDTAPRANTESYAVKEALAAGDMAPEKTLNQLLETNLRQLRDKTGILIDGYPRNIQQVMYFEKKYKQRPPIILLDCSKLQLGRGRIDDTVSSFRRRLELFREQTLPMLKTLDSSNRLQIVDGDTDSPSVQREFERLIRNHIQHLLNKTDGQNNAEAGQVNHVIRNEQTDAILHDLETNVPGAVPTISHHVSMMNGHLKNQESALASAKRPAQMMNGHVGGRPGTGPVAPLAQPVDFRHMLEEAERYPVDSYM